MAGNSSFIVFMSFAHQQYKVADKAVYCSVFNWICIRAGIKRRILLEDRDDKKLTRALCELKSLDDSGSILSGLFLLLLCRVLS